MLEKEPLISIILPVFNRVEFLEDAIGSVLSQTYQNWELIVSDDASAPKTRDFLKQYESYEKVKVRFNERNVGLFANLNKGIEESSGEYILLLCSDDRLLPDCLKSTFSIVLLCAIM